MKPLTAQEIAELRRLDSEGTTDGPWTAGPHGELETPGGYSLLAAGSEVGWVFDLKADAEWTAAARNALPRLLDEVERSRALLKRIEWVAGIVTWFCPSCCFDKERGHEPGCELAALIGGTT
jgi:hypothetical protein